jgi:hypothetical protein
MSTSVTAIVHYDPKDHAALDPATIVPCATGNFASLRLGGHVSVIISTSEDAYMLLHHVERAARLLREEGL